MLGLLIGIVIGLGIAVIVVKYKKELLPIKIKKDESNDKRRNSSK
jgi:hypothetical protein